MTGGRTTRTSEHEAFEQLAAGYALDALEPEDEQLFVRHLAACARCERDLTVHRETAAQLAWAAVPSAPERGQVPDELFGRIRAAVLAESGEQAFAGSGTRPRRGSVRLDPAAGAGRRPAGPGPRAATRRPGGPSSRQPPRGVALIAAAASLVLALGVVGVVVEPLRDSGADRGQQVAQALASVDDGRRVPLVDDAGREAAVAVVSGGTVSLVVHGLPSNAREDSVYVLWSLPRGGAPRALDAFDVRSDEVQVRRDLPLPDGGEVAGLAVTREPGDAAPQAPGSAPLVTGELPA